MPTDVADAADAADAENTLVAGFANVCGYKSILPMFSTHLYGKRSP